MTKKILLPGGKPLHEFAKKRFRMDYSPGTVAAEIRRMYEDANEEVPPRLYQTCYKIRHR